MDFCFLANWDGFLPFKNQSSKTMDVATLSLLMLPPALRMQAELLFTWWGVSGHPSNLNPFLCIALEDFFDSIEHFANEAGTTIPRYVCVCVCRLITVVRAASPAPTHLV